MINTGGHQVQAMPNFSPVDPKLAAFNPAEATRGILQAYQLHGTAAELASFKQHAKEVAETEKQRTDLLNYKVKQAQLEADLKALTKESEIAATNARNEVITAQSASAIRDNQFTEKWRPTIEKGREQLIPLENQTALSDASLKAEESTAALARVETVQKTQDSLAKVAEARAAFANANMPIEQETEMAKMRLLSDLAKQAAELNPVQFKLTMDKAKRDILNAEGDEELARKHQKATTDLILAQIEDVRAKVNGTGGYNKFQDIRDQAFKQITNLTATQDRIMGMEFVSPVTGLVGTLNNYLADTREGGAFMGDKKQKGWIIKKDVETNPQAEAAINEHMFLEDEKQRIFRAISGDGQSGGSQQSGAGQSGSSNSGVITIDVDADGNVSSVTKPQTPAASASKETPANVATQPPAKADGVDWGKAAKDYGVPTALLFANPAAKLAGSAADKAAKALGKASERAATKLNAIARLGPSNVAGNIAGNIAKKIGAAVIGRGIPVASQVYIGNKLLGEYFSSKFGTEKMSLTEAIAAGASSPSFDEQAKAAHLDQLIQRLRLVATSTNMTALEKKREKDVIEGQILQLNGN